MSKQNTIKQTRALAQHGQGPGFNPRKKEEEREEKRKREERKERKNREKERKKYKERKEDRNYPISPNLMNDMYLHIQELKLTPSR